MARDKSKKVVRRTKKRVPSESFPVILDGDNRICPHCGEINQFQSQPKVETTDIPGHFKFTRVCNHCNGLSWYIKKI